MSNHKKKFKKELAQLNSLAYERDLDEHLKQLDDKFRQWKAGELSGFDLAHELYKFSKGEARELYVMYNSGMHDIYVARAFLLGYLKREEIPDEVFDFLQRAMEVVKR